MTMMHREPLLKLVLRFDGDGVTARFMVRVAVSVKLGFGLELSVDDNVSLFPYCYEIQGQTNVYIYI